MGEFAEASLSVNILITQFLNKSFLRQHRGMPNYSPFPRHMIGVGYCAERDPNGECSHLGLGKHWHTFSTSARAAFERVPSTEPILVDRNVKFVEGSCDAFGNSPPSRAGSDDDGVIESGPYAGATKGAGSRFDYFLPDTPVADYCVAATRVNAGS